MYLCIVYLCTRVFVYRVFVYRIFVYRVFVILNEFLSRIVIHNLFASVLSLVLSCSLTFSFDSFPHFSSESHFHSSSDSLSLPLFWFSLSFLFWISSDSFFFPFSFFCSSLNLIEIWYLGILDNLFLDQFSDLSGKGKPWYNKDCDPESGSNPIDLKVSWSEEKHGGEHFDEKHEDHLFRKSSRWD